MTDKSDPLAPVAGDAVQIVGGQFRGQSGTLVKRNGNSMLVVLHASMYTVVRTLDGGVHMVPTAHLLDATPCCPAAKYVVQKPGGSA